MDAKVSHVITLVLMLMLLYGTVESTQCPGLNQCLYGNRTTMNGGCTWSGSLVDCVARLKNVCTMKEEGITFQEIGTLSLQFCQHIGVAMASTTGNCKTVGQCVLRSEIVTKLREEQERNTTSNTQQSIMLESKTWCRYLDANARCFLAGADTCYSEKSFLSFMTRQHEHLSAVCSSASYGGKQATGKLIAVLLWAVFIVRTLSSH